MAGRAITHGMSHVVGDIAVGKLADLVLWQPSNFGVKPETIIKGGVIAWAQIGDANGVRASFLWRETSVTDAVWLCRVFLPCSRSFRGRCGVVSPRLQRCARSSLSRLSRLAQVSFVARCLLPCR